MSSERRERRGWELLTAVLLAAAGLAVVEAVQSVERPVRGVTDPGVVTTRQAITPAGVQSVFDGRVYGVAFGASASELWVLTGRTRAGKAQLYRLDWLKNAVGGRWELEGAPALQGLAFDPERGSPLVGLIVPPRAVNNRAGGAVRLLARSVSAPGRRRRLAMARVPSRRWPTISAATSPAGPRWRGPRAARWCRWCSRTSWRSWMPTSGRLEGRVKTGAWRRSARRSAATARRPG